MGNGSAGDGTGIEAEPGKLRVQSAAAHSRVHVVAVAAAAVLLPPSSSRSAFPCAHGPGRSRRRRPRGRAGPSLAEQGERGAVWRLAELGQALAAAGSYPLVRGGADKWGPSPRGLAGCC